MIPIVKSNFQPENLQAIWIDTSVKPASFKIFREDGWATIGTDEEIVNSIIEQIETQKTDIDNINKEVSNNVLKKKSLATIDNASIEQGGNIDLSQTYALKTDVANSLQEVNNKIEETFTQQEKEKLEGIEAGANKTIVDSSLSTTSENPVQNKVVTASLNQAGQQATTALKLHTDNNKIHIPSGGSKGQLLQSNGDDTTTWVNIDLLDILTYGVSWKPNVADPDLTRIGNPILHRTLPIQSGIKGCIAQCKTDSGKPQIMYWLDENDWRFRKIPEILYGQELIVSNDVYTIVNSVFSTNRYLKQYIKVNNVIAQVTEIDTETTTATIVLDSVVEAGTYNVELGAVLNGYDGEVKNYVPKFYYKSYDGSDERWVRISQFQIDNSWIESKANLVSVCNPTILRSVPSDMGYLSTLESGAIVCIFNDNAYCRGGDNSSTYDLDTDIFRRNLGKPVTNMTRTSMRGACKKSGNHITSYNEYKAIFYWLFVIEYATFNCQKSFNPELTSEGYHQGGLGAGVTNVGNWNYYNNYNPITPCGYGTKYGNNTYSIPITFMVPTASGTDPTLTQNTQIARWRGFNNIFGDIWNNTDGIIIDANAGLEGRNNMNIVYVSDNPDDFNDSDISKYYIAGYEVHSEGYTKEWALGDKAEIIPRIMGGSESLYKCDYHWVGEKNSTLRTLFLGGDAYTGSRAGLGYFASYSSVDYFWTAHGLWSSCFIED